MKKLVLTLPFLFLANLALASGFALYEFSARGNAMGGAVMAGEAEPASLATNPALITELPGKQMQLGATVVTATGHVVYGGVSQFSERQWWPLPHFYYTQQLDDNLWFGVGTFARFGLSNDYEDKGWLLPTPTLYHVGVTTYSIQPTVAYKATDKLSFALGMEAQYLNFTEKINFGPSKMNLDGDSVAISGIFALFYNVNEKVNFGANFRLKSNHNVTGPAKYSTEVSSMFVNGGDFWGDISFPAQLTLGASWKATDKLLLEFNWTNVFWSCFDAIDIYFDHAPGAGTPGLMGNHQNNSKKYQDAYRIGFGAEYILTDAVKLRGSFIFDKSPINKGFMDPMLPVDDRFVFGTGAGFKLSENTILDLSYNLLFATRLNGVNAAHTTTVHYGNSTSHLMGLSFRYKF